MKNEISNPLIERLVSEHRPVKRFLNEKIRTLIWFIGMISTVGMLVILFSPQSFSKLLTDEILISENFYSIILIIISIIIGRLVFLLAIPGAISQQYLKKRLVIIGSLLVISTLIYFQWGLNHISLNYRGFCYLETFAYSLITSIPLFLVFKKSGYLNSQINLILISCASCCLSLAMISMVCKHGAFHHGLSHLTPALIFSLLFVFIVSRLNAKLLSFRSLNESKGRRD